MPLAPAARILVIFLLLLSAFSEPSASVSSVAVASAAPGFWEGLVHGLLSVPKLLASPFLEVVLVSPGRHLLSYDIGFYAGVLLFAGGGAALAASTPTTYEPAGAEQQAQSRVQIGSR
jgi:hypothetical protein